MVAEWWFSIAVCWCWRYAPWPYYIIWVRIMGLGLYISVRRFPKTSSGSDRIEGERYRWDERKRHGPVWQRCQIMPRLFSFRYQAACPLYYVLAQKVHAPAPMLQNNGNGSDRGISYIFQKEN